MTGSEEHIEELIERYVLEQMSEEELRTFEKTLRSDLDLAERVREFRILKEVIQSDSKVSDFQEAVQSVIQKKKEQPTINLWWKVAAILILVLASIIALFQLNLSQDPPELALSYFEPFPDLITSREDTDSLVFLAMTAYNDQAYEQATSHLERLVDPENHLFEFYLGICYQADGKYEKSLALWIKMEAYGESTLNFAIKWYKALALLGLNKSDEASNLLHELAAEPSSVQTRAQQLLEEI